MVCFFSIPGKTSFNAAGDGAVPTPPGWFEVICALFLGMASREGCPGCASWLSEFVEGAMASWNMGFEGPAIDALVAALKRAQQDSGQHERGSSTLTQKLEESECAGEAVSHIRPSMLPEKNFVCNRLSDLNSNCSIKEVLWLHQPFGGPSTDQEFLEWMADWLMSGNPAEAARVRSDHRSVSMQPSMITNMVS